ncbi:hypothetical protein Runsl_0681 [Runella slithyformis DSM 19594]|uniref:Uncharacterized protein n=1 Tax=Runella slithyformis (strain ATCC 29530 / DSM 19594 / LMG 11500 / NCIMB 11436 / LSU 4) TaxID=761193 RepID=A0A7U4E4B6_RUNSL|nr:hypothetical protein Runsl_0681 [Runella slithyformis DSM 19594]
MARVEFLKWLKKLFFADFAVVSLPEAVLLSLVPEDKAVNCTPNAEAGEVEV